MREANVFKIIFDCLINTNDLHDVMRAAAQAPKAAQAREVAGCKLLTVNDLTRPGAIYANKSDQNNLVMTLNESTSVVVP